MEYETNCGTECKSKGSQEQISYLQKKINAFNAVEFLKEYPDPEKVFNNYNRWRSTTYRTHAKIFLRNKFQNFSIAFLDKTLSESNNSLSDSYIFLEKLEKGYRGSDFTRKPIPHPQQAMPDVPHEYFYDECMFVLHRSEIMDIVQATKKRKEEASLLRRIDEAKKAGELQSCPNCHSNDLLPEHMFICQKGHKFCSKCEYLYKMATGEACPQCMEDEEYLEEFEDEE